MGLATLVKAVVNGHPGKQFSAIQPFAISSDFQQISQIQAQSLAASVLNRMQYARFHREQDSSAMPVLAQNTLLACTETQDIHGMTLVLSRTAQMITLKCPKSLN